MTSHTAGFHPFHGPGHFAGRASRALRESWEVLKDTLTRWLADNVPQHAAALAYYTTFSLAPVLVIATGIAALIFGADAARGQVSTQLSALLGPSAAEGIEGLISRASHSDNHGVLATVIGVVVLVIGATSVFAQLQDTLNAVMGGARKRRSGLWALLRQRLISFAMVISVGFLLLVSLVASAALAALGDWSSGFLGDHEGLMHALNLFVSMVVITAMFALLFKFVPDRHPRWHDVWPGALATAALFSVGKFAIGLYLGKAGISSTWGGLGAIAVLLIWVYYSSFILLLGAELTRALEERRHGPLAKTQTPA
ncbi:MAG: YihY/virulence factor BrkB family protein [Myxococcaceae bacterium]